MQPLGLFLMAPFGAIMVDSKFIRREKGASAMHNRNKIAWAAAVIWMAIIFMLSHQPASVSSGISSGITEFILDSFKNIFGGNETRVEEIHTIVRKNAHFFAYFILSSLLLNAIRTKGDLCARDCAVAFVVSVLYAISDEVHQLFIDGRSGEVRDVLIDSAGAVTGIAVYGLLFLVRKRRDERKVSAQGELTGR